jgi:presenilin-like A22 family membrane protease
LNVIAKISRLLSLDKVQRLCYIAALLLWLLMWQDDFRYYNATSSLGVKYIWLISIPATMLLLQAILNKTILWATIFGLVLVYTIYAVYLTLTDIIERSGNHVKAISWDLKSFLLLIFIFGLLFIINWTIFKLKPNGTTKKHTA